MLHLVVYGGNEAVVPWLDYSVGKSPKSHILKYLLMTGIAVEGTAVYRLDSLSEESIKAEILSA